MGLMVCSLCRMRVPGLGIRAYLEVGWLWLQAQEGVVRPEGLRELGWAGPGDPAAGPKSYLQRALI